MLKTNANHKTIPLFDYATHNAFFAIKQKMIETQVL